MRQNRTSTTGFLFLKSSTAQQLSFEWPQFKNYFTVLKVCPTIRTSNLTLMANGFELVSVWVKEGGVVLKLSCEKECKVKLFDVFTHVS